ncbi:hypothetical protein [Moraxella lacunata]|jgi:hypothetical protein
MMLKICLILMALIQIKYFIYIKAIEKRLNIQVKQTKSLINFLKL